MKSKQRPFKTAEHQKAPSRFVIPQELIPRHLLKTWKPAVLVADIGMPDVDGHQLIRRIRELPKRGGREIPAVAVTAYASEVDRERALAAGYYAHLAKPFQPERLMAIVAKLIEPQSRRGVRKKKVRRP